jgi:hypothetical protein
MHHLGSGIWSHKRMSGPAILVVQVPATMSTSACRGLARNGKNPKRSMSCLLVAAEIMSMAQHANPESNGHRLFTRMRSSTTSALVGMTSNTPDQRASSRRPRPLASNSARCVMSLWRPPS